MKDGRPSEGAEEAESAERAGRYWKKQRCHEESEGVMEGVWRVMGGVVTGLVLGVPLLLWAVSRRGWKFRAFRSLRGRLRAV